MVTNAQKHAVYKVTDTIEVLLDCIGLSELKNKV
jgi:hypothetical protein